MCSDPLGLHCRWHMMPIRSTPPANMRSELPAAAEYAVQHHQAHRGASVLAGGACL